MKTEIERKFLVKNCDYKKFATDVMDIKQGFLNRDKHRTVRIRVQKDRAFITVKGVSSKDGLSRLEWEKEIDTQDANALLSLCDGNIIHKTRYEVPVGNHIFEVDEFYLKNKGLVIAEIELNHTTEQFKKPNWLGKEVTGVSKYYNSNL